MTEWAHAGPSIAAAFLASLVEFAEALTVVLAVAAVRGWRPALTGPGLGLGALALLVIALGPALARIPLDLVQLVVRVLLLLFGLRWLRKAILRAAGVIPLHDEDAAFAAQTATLQRGVDAVGIATAFKIVMLEGIEVVFIVVAIGAAGGLLVPASPGAAAAVLAGRPLRAGRPPAPPPPPGEARQIHRRRASRGFRPVLDSGAGGH